MHFLGTALAVAVGVATLACDASNATCSSTTGRQGVSYDVSKSRFAFGGAPTKTIVSSQDVRWAGPDGAILLSTSDSTVQAFAALDPNAPQANLAPATDDFATAQAYARDYFEALGVPACQIVGGEARHDELLVRVVEGIPVPDSTATATFDIDYQTTSEQFYWPEIPGDAVSEAESFKSALGSVSALAAFKRLLPDYAQGQGQVVIHHSTAAGVLEGPFSAVATYDVPSTSSANGFETLSFDAAAHVTTLPL